MNKNQTILYLALGILALAVLFFITRPKKANAPNSLQTTIASQNAHNQNVSSDSANANKPVVLVIKSNTLIAGPQTITVNQGDSVTIKIVSDSADEFHLHGYDKKVNLEPNVLAQISFKANTTDRFEYELENAKVSLGALEVQPR